MCNRANAAAVLALLLCAACPGATQSHIEEPRDGAQLVKVGARRVQVDCRGSGGPTLVLDAAHGADSTSLSAAASALRSGRRVCTYDRAGLGQSEADPAGVRSVQLMVYDLRHALRAAGERGPLILVAHGVSSYVARLYASQAPEQVAALILVGPIHLGMEASLLARLDPKHKRAWLSEAAKREPLDYARSRTLMNASFIDGVPTAIVPRDLAVAPLTRAGLSPEQAEKLRAHGRELQTRLAETLGAKTYADADAAIAALTAGGDSKRSNSASADAE